MSLIERLAGFAPWALASLLLAGIVHLASILLMPQVAPHDSYARLAAYLGPGGVHALPAVDPGQEVLPFLDPAFAYAACGYDLSAAPLRLRAVFAPGALVALSFHSRKGQLYYSLTDRAASRGKIDILVLTATQLAAAEAQDNEDEALQELRLLAPDRRGFVLLRALAASPGDLAQAQARLAAVTCTPEPQAGQQK